MPGSGIELVENVGAALAQWAIDYVRAHPVREWRTKASPADPVTAVDVAIEKHVRSVIGDAFPDDVVVGEEMGGESSSTTPTWYLDPIDGTANLAHGLAWSSFSLSRVDTDGVQFGVVADVWRGSISTATRGNGAQNDGSPLTVRDVEDQNLRAREAETDDADALHGSIIVTELLNQSPWPGFECFLHEASRAWATLRVPGSGALSLAQVAGMTEGAAVIHEFHLIDHLAGAFIAQQAGAVLLDATGGPASLPLDGPLIIATNPRLGRAVSCLYRHATEGATK